MVTAQPASATYEQGAQATDLSIKAQADDGVGAVTYEWFTKTAAGETSTGVKSANMPVDTSKAGATEYFCRVTGAGGRQRRLRTGDHHGHRAGSEARSQARGKARRQAD